MNHLSYATRSLKKEEVDKNWLLVDAEGVKLGRLCSQVASLVRGKHKTSFTPNVDCGDNVVIINASKVLLSGAKHSDKTYISHTGYPGGQRIKTTKMLREQNPTRIITEAVKGMIPKSKLGHKLRGNYYVYAGAEHDKQAQQPKPFSLNY